MRTKTTIRINKELLTKAQQYGLNLSRTVENLLQIYFEGIEQVQNQIRQQTNKDFSLSEGSLFRKEKVPWWGSWDLNPGPPAPQAGILDHSSQNWTKIPRFLEARRLPH